MQVTSCVAACFGLCLTLYIPESGTISPGLYGIFLQLREIWHAPS